MKFHKSYKAFTLLELLVAVTISAIVVLMVYKTFYTATKVLAEKKNNFIKRNDLYRYLHLFDSYVKKSERHNYANNVLEFKYYDKVLARFIYKEQYVFSENLLPPFNKEKFDLQVNVDTLLFQYDSILNQKVLYYYKESIIFGKDTLINSKLLH